jgi:hypothetical protein
MNAVCQPGLSGPNWQRATIGLSALAWMRLAGQRTVLKPFQQQLPLPSQVQRAVVTKVSTHRIS